MAEIQILTRAATCWCHGKNTPVNVVCNDCSGSKRTYKTTHRIVPPLPSVSMTRWARFKRRVGFEHPLELQEWLRDMEHRFVEREAELDAEARALWGDHIEIIPCGNPGKGKTYGVKGP